MKPISEAIREALVAKGWTFDETAEENTLGERLQFIHPETLRRHAWLDAIFAEMDREARGLHSAKPEPRS